MRALKTCFANGILLLAALPGSWMPASAGALDALVLPREQEFALSLGSITRIYEDRTGGLDFEQVRRLSAENPDIFRQAEIETRTTAHPHSAWWLQVTLANTAYAVRHLVLVAGAPNLENVDFYLQRRSETRHARAGTLVPILEQEDLSRFPTLRFDMARDETVRVWLKIKSHTPYSPSPVLYTSRLFTTAATMTTSANGILIGVVVALVWCTLLIGIIARRPPFLWMAAIAATALSREAVAREYLQRLLWPLDSAWGYRLELTLDFAYLALCAMFVRSAGRREALPVPGARIYPAATAALSGCFLLAMLLPPHVAPLRLPAAVWLFQGLSGILAAGMLGSAMLLARRARSAPSPPPLARHAAPIAALLGMSAIFIVADAIIRTTGPLLATPLLPLSFILRSGLPGFALLAVAANLTVLWLWAASQLAGLRRSRTLAMSRSRAMPTPLALPKAKDVPPIRTKEQAAAASTQAGQQVPVTAITPDSTQASSTDAPGTAAKKNAERQATILSYVGHDLRAPLAIISGYIRLLRQAAAPAQHAYLDVIERSVAHQFSLIEEILAYSKSELQPFTIHPEETNLPALLEELAHFGIALCAHQRNTFEYLPAPTLPAAVWIDGKRLRQAVLNLLSNASKFTNEGTVRLDAQVRRQADRQAELHLSVFNDGPHISSEDQADIFVAFRKLQRRESGLGLGLFIVERIAHGMGGIVRVESAPERGNRFSLTLPVTLVHQSVVATRPIGRVPARVVTDAQLEAPPLAVRLVLSRLARDGELSEIEKWAAETRELYPRYTGFYEEVAKCVEIFDMECLQRLALQGVT